MSLSRQSRLDEWGGQAASHVAPGHHRARFGQHGTWHSHMPLVLGWPARRHGMPHVNQGSPASDSAPLCEYLYISGIRGPARPRILRAIR